MSVSSGDKILCVGEILWDALPTGLYLGGAPFNVVYHLHQLGEDSRIISRVGDDRLGNEAIRQVKQKQLSAEFIQQDPQLETGFVEVAVDKEGTPNYTFAQPVAWDNIALTSSVEDILSETWAIVYGSLAQRNKRTRNTLRSLLGNDVLKVFDLNLRKPFYDKTLIEESLLLADIIKMNGQELHILQNWFSLPPAEKEAMEALMHRFDCTTAAVTQGAQGASIHYNNDWLEAQGFNATVKDTVGAGDAFLAALLHGIRAQKKISELLAFANGAGALVASFDGGTSDYGKENIEAFIVSR